MADIIHMNVPACEEVRNQMNSTRTTIEEQMNAIYGRVDGMVGNDWIADGATQFKGDFDQWKSQVMQALSRLEEITNSFNTEIERMRQEQASYK